MSEKRDIMLFIDDVSGAIDKIQGYVIGIDNAKDFRNSGKTYDAVMMNFIIIGEAVKNIYEEVRVHHPDVEWRQIMAMRNLLAHEYWGVDGQVVWTAIGKNLPKLKDILIMVKASLK
jgi:uncharacterized protein with HEPN domain